MVDQKQGLCCHNQLFVVISHFSVNRLSLSLTLLNGPTSQGRYRYQDVNILSHAEPAIACKSRSSLSSIIIRRLYDAVTLPKVVQQSAHFNFSAKNYPLKCLTVGKPHSFIEMLTASTTANVRSFDIDI